MQILEGHLGPIRRVAYSPDGARLASCGEDNTVRLWDLMTGRRPRTLRGRQDRGVGVIYDVAFSPDGKRVAAAESSGFVRLWSLPDNRRASLGGEAGAVSSLAFGPGGGALLWATLRGHLAYRGLADGVPLWSTEFEENRAVWCVAFAPDGGTVAVGFGTEPGAVRLVKPSRSSSRDVVMNVPTRVRGLAFSADGRLLAAASGPEVFVWSSPRPISAGGTGSASASKLGRTVLRGHTGTIRGLAFGPDGASLATASYDGTVRLWDAAEGVETARFDWGIGRTDCVAFSPDGMTLAAGGERDVIIWDAGEGA